MQKKYVAFIVVFLLCTFLVNASFNFYNSYGNDEGIQRNILGVGTLSYTLVAPSGSAKGSFSEPLVDDLNNDQIQEIVVQGGNNLLSVYEGNNIESPVTEFEIGNMVASPATCDVDGDGRRDIVGVFEYNGTNRIAFLSFANGVLSVLAIGVTDPVNGTGNVVCNQFYSPQGDDDFRVMWVDQTKLLHIAKYVGTIIVNEVTVDPVVSLVDTATTLESSNPTKYPSGSHEIVASDSFDLNNNRAVMYIAGNSTIYYSSDGNAAAKDFTQYTTGTRTPQVLHIVGDVRHAGSTGKTSVAVYSSNNQYTGAPLGAEWIVVTKQVNSAFNPRSLQVQSNNSWTGANLAVCAQGRTSHSLAVGDENNDGISDFYDIIRTKADAPCALGSRTYFRIVRSDNGQLLRSTIPTPASTDTSPYDRIYLSRSEAGTSPDVTYIEGGRVQILTDSSNFSTTINVFNVTVTSPYIYAPIPVDFDKDNLLDMIHTTPTSTFFYESNAGSNTRRNFPFSVQQNASSGSLQKSMKVTVGFNSTNTVYNYALSCDLSQQTVWNEQFRTGYNFTERNVSANVLPMEEFLTFNGIVFTINSTFPQFDIEKYANEGVRDTTSLRLVYQSNNDIDVDLLMFADDSQLTNYLRLNKTNNTISLYKVVPGEDPLTIVNFTVVGGFVSVGIEFTPTFDANTQTYYFTTVIKSQNVTIASTSTAQFTGQNIRNVEFFSTKNSTFRVQQLGFFKIPNPQPPFVQFQNGQIITQSGITVTNPSPSEEITGSGFVVIPDFNEVFYSRCEYPASGVYTQRHFIAEIDALPEYSNFHDLTVTVLNTSSTVGLGTSDTNDVVVGGINDLFESLGITSPAIKFILWVLLAVGVAALGLYVHWVLSVVLFVIMLIVGAMLLIVPLWIVVVIVIITAALVAMAFRFVFNGG